MKEFAVKIKPLTPIWTGDANRQNTTLRETGIIGSLRWWYEALIRGLGGTACDPTDTKCEGENHCAACELFGCTGWARKFRLEINEVNKSYAPFVIAKNENNSKPYFLGFYNKSGNEFKKNGGLMGEYELNFNVDDDILDLIKLLILLSTKWGIGSGVQKGFGIANTNEEIQFSIEEKTFLKHNICHSVNYKLPLPQIDKFFFYRIPIKEKTVSEIEKCINKNIFKTMTDLKNNKLLNFSFENSFNYIPTSPWVRHSIRMLFKDKDVLRHLIMGFVSDNNIQPIHTGCWQHSIVKDKNNQNKYYCRFCKQGNIDEKDILDKTGSKIYVSHIYDKNAFFRDKEPLWEMKIWGWIPNLPSEIKANSEDVKNLLETEFKKDEFWKSVFNISDNPVIMNQIWSEWNIKSNLSSLLDSGGKLYE